MINWVEVQEEKGCPPLGGGSKQSRPQPLSSRSGRREPLRRNRNRGTVSSCGRSQSEDARLKALDRTY